VTDSHDRSDIECLLTGDEIAARVDQLGRQISTDYADREMVVVGVLKGSWVFMADLVRRLTCRLTCDFVRVSSYGMGTETSGEPQLLLDVRETLAGKHVLLIDDILDTGVSIQWLLRHLQGKAPASVRLCVLLDKPSRRRVEVRADYIGFEIPDKFVVGYGLDAAERFRELPFVGYVKASG